MEAGKAEFNRSPLSEQQLIELYGPGGLEAIKRGLQERVDALKAAAPDSGIPDTQADWLGELEKDELWREHFTGQEGAKDLMNPAERMVLASLRAQMPSSEDLAWREAYPTS